MYATTFAWPGLRRKSSPNLLWRPLLPTREAIASHSGGWPRLVNNLARTSLLLGAQLKQNPIDAETVRLASADASL